MAGGPAADLDRELQRGEQAGAGPSGVGLAVVAAELLRLGGQAVEVVDAAGGEQLLICIDLLLPPGAGSADGRWWCLHFGSRTLGWAAWLRRGSGWSTAACPAGGARS